MKKFWQSKILWNNLLGLAALAIQSQTSYLAPVEAQAALLAVSNMVLRTWFSGQAIDMSQVKTSFDKLLLGKRGLPVLLLIGLTLSGCSTLKVIDEQPVLSEFAVRVAVGRVLTEHPAWAQPAQEISANALRLVKESTEVLLPDLSTYVTSQIPWTSLTPEEAALLQLLVAAIAAEIESGLPAPDLLGPQDVKVRVATVLGWIHQVAELHALQNLRVTGIEWPTVAPTVAAAMQTRTIVRECKAALLAAMRLHGDQYQLQASYLCLDEAEDHLALAAVEQAAAAADRKFGL